MEITTQPRELTKEEIRKLKKKESNAKYYEKHKEERKEHNKAYYHENETYRKQKIEKIMSKYTYRKPRKTTSIVNE